MSQKLFIKQLEEFGLSGKEALTYLALLELEISTVSELANTTGVNRTSTYVVLESLKKKGLVSTSEDKAVQSYIAISPDMLLFEAQNRALQAQEIKDKISSMVPELKALHKDTKTKPKVKVFEGKQGVLAAWEDSLHAKEKLIRLSCSYEQWVATYDHFADYFAEYTKLRLAAKIKSISIHPLTELTGQFIQLKSKQFDKPVVIPKSRYSFPTEMMIYDDKVAYLSPGKKSFAIVIESKDIAEGMKSTFDLAYEEAKRLNEINKLVDTYKKSLTKYSEK